MRKPAEVLELALSLLDMSRHHSYYMCCHLDWMDYEGYISTEEKHAARSCIAIAICGFGTLRSYLFSINVIPYGLYSDSPEYRRYQVEFYTNLIATLKQE